MKPNTNLIRKFKTEIDEVQNLQCGLCSKEFLSEFTLVLHCDPCLEILIEEI